MKTVFDFGMYDASDTIYYLEEGHKVVAVEANPALVERARSLLKKHLDSGQLQLINAAISNDSKSVELTICGDDLGSSSVFDGKVANRTPVGRFTVPGITTQEVLERHGVPDYFKIDLEGADRLCVQSLSVGTKPEYLSFEIDENFEELTTHIASIGFTKFKMINQLNFRELSNQNKLQERVARRLMRMFGYSEPQYVKRGTRWFKTAHSSGPVPWCSDGRWCSLDEMLNKWRRAKAEDRIWGWYDLHAA